MRVDNRVHLGARSQNIEMYAPFRRWLLWAPIRSVTAIERHSRDHLRGHRFVRNARWRDQHLVAKANRDVAGRSLIETNGIHPAALVHDGLAELTFADCHGG